MINNADSETAGQSPADAHQAPGSLPDRPFSPLRLIRVAVAGALMGTANLIPGVSGGTMILAMGLYQEFIDSVADLTALRFSVRRLVFIGVLGTFALSAILGLAGLILYLLFHHTAAMFALFMGLTLGGVPMLLRTLRPIRADVVIATIAGFLLMVGVFLLKGGDGLPHNTGMDFVSGVVGSTTMVLPGISGSYMLLIMDQYERVVGSVHDLKEAARARDTSALKSCLAIIVPVGIGAVLGIIALSNILKILLQRWSRPTIGVLLGILLGSVIGLWPFDKQPSQKSLERRDVAELRSFVAHWDIPNIDDATADERLAGAIQENWDRRRRSSYEPATVAFAAALLVAGFAMTGLLGQAKREA